jgi:hypothetical protein
MFCDLLDIDVGKPNFWIYGMGREYGVLLVQKLMDDVSRPEFFLIEFYCILVTQYQYLSQQTNSCNGFKNKL